MGKCSFTFRRGVTLTQSCHVLNFLLLLTLVLQLGVLYPQTDFYPVALELLRILTKALVTFPEYMWANKC